MKFSLETAAPLFTWRFFHSSTSLDSCIFLRSYAVTGPSSECCWRCTAAHLLTNPAIFLSLIFSFLLFFIGAVVAADVGTLGASSCMILDPSLSSCSGSGADNSAICSSRSSLLILISSGPLPFCNNLSVTLDLPPCTCVIAAFCTVFGAMVVLFSTSISLRFFKTFCTFSPSSRSLVLVLRPLTCPFFQSSIRRSNSTLTLINSDIFVPSGIPGQASLIQQRIPAIIASINSLPFASVRASFSLSTEDLESLVLLFSEDLGEEPSRFREVRAPLSLSKAFLASISAFSYSSGLVHVVAPESLFQKYIFPVVLSFTDLHFVFRFSSFLILVSKSIACFFFFSSSNFAFSLSFFSFSRWASSSSCFLFASSSACFFFCSSISSLICPMKSASWDFISSAFLFSSFSFATLSASAFARSFALSCRRSSRSFLASSRRLFLSARRRSTNSFIRLY
mmetsp:Transcript_12394/g.17253  ORF Transcript_12394/g.17253 Transcript_12394/m.17253 type:complete len:452 (-) Transcript_12394:392-1747(-)